MSSPKKAYRTHQVINPAAPLLDSDSITTILRALNRVKRISEETGEMQYILISFNGSEMIFSESHCMVKKTIAVKLNRNVNGQERIDAAKGQ